MENAFEWKNGGGVGEFSIILCFMRQKHCFCEKITPEFSTRKID